MSKLIITRMEISGISCSVCILTEDQKIMELQLEPENRKSILDNIYVGQVRCSMQHSGCICTDRTGCKRLSFVGRRENSYFQRRANCR